MIKLGRRSYPQGIAHVSATLEAISITINPATGSDPLNPLLLRTQAEATSKGSFATILAAIASLPNSIRHTVTLTIVDGLYQLTSEMFGDLTRFAFGYDSSGNPGHIKLAGTNWTRAGGTSTYTVQSISSVNGTFTLSADPGFSANQYRTYYARGVSGTGAGSYRPIRSHSGTLFYISGDVPFATNSVLEIVTPSTQLRLPSQYPYLTLPKSAVGEMLELSRIELLPPIGLESYLYVYGGSIYLTDGFRGANVGFALNETWLYHDTSIISVANLSPVVAYGGGRIRTYTGASRPIMLATVAGYSGIELYGSKEGSSYLFGSFSIDGAAAAALYVQTGAIQLGPSGSAYPRCSTTTPYAIEALDASLIVLDNLPGMQTSTFRGATKDLLIDTIGIDWSDVNADPNDTAIGVRNTTVMPLF